MAAAVDLHEVFIPGQGLQRDRQHLAANGHALLYSHSLSQIGRLVVLAHGLHAHLHMHRLQQHNFLSKCSRSLLEVAHHVQSGEVFFSLSFVCQQFVVEFLMYWWCGVNSGGQLIVRTTVISDKAE